MPSVHAGTNRWTSVAVLLTLASAAWSGCIDEAPTSPAHFSHIGGTESAEYDVLTEDGAWRGNVSVSLEWNDDATITARADLYLETYPDAGTTRFNRYQSESTFDSRTGEHLRLAYTGELAVDPPNSEDLVAIQQPSGIDRVMPANGMHGVQDGIARLDHHVVPVGPQWILFTTDDPQGNTSWGEAAATWNQNETGWRVTLRGTCQHDCGLYAHHITEVPETVTWTLTGTGAGLLPTRVDLIADNTTERLILERTHHQVTEGPHVPDRQAPTPSEQRQGLCNGIPCEEEGWPADLSLQRGLTALTSHPRFLAWNATQDGSEVHRITVLPGSVQSATPNRWLIEFHAQNGAAQADLVAPAGTPAQVPVLVSFEEQDAPESTTGRPYPSITGARSLQASATQAMALRDFGLDDVPHLSYGRLDGGWRPDARTSYTLGFLFPDGEDGLDGVHVSAVGGPWAEYASAFMASPSARSRAPGRRVRGARPGRLVRPCPACGSR